MSAPPTDSHQHIQPWAANLILSGVNRLDCAITAFGSVMMELDDDPERGDASEVQAIRWLYEMLRNEAHNIRTCVAGAQGKPMSEPSD
jgi:hypothetical protein